jgi:hypothetical protein
MRWTHLTIAFVISAGGSALILISSAAFGERRRSSWARAALTKAAALIKKLDPDTGLDGAAEAGLRPILASVRTRIALLWWCRFGGASVLVGALLSGAASSSLGSRPVVAFALGAILGALFVTAVSGAYTARYGKQGAWLEVAVSGAIANGSAEVAAAFNFGRRTLASGQLDQQLGPFVQVAKAMAGDSG